MATKIKKAGRAVVLLVAALLLFTSCRVTHYNRDDIKNYMQEKYPGIAYTLARSSQTVKLENGDKAKIWEAYFDAFPQFPFYVYSSATYVAEHMSYSIGDTAGVVFGTHYFDNFNFGPVRAYCTADEANLAHTLRVYIPYRSRQGLEETRETMQAFAAYIKEQPVPCRIQYNFDYISPLEVVDDDIYTEAWGSEVDDAMYDEALNRLAAYCASVQIGIDEFSQQELAAGTAYTEKNFAFVLPDGTTGYYEDLAKNGDISYGVLFELLHRTEYPVEGNPRHFSFVGTDGNEYEFSYSFNDELFQVYEEVRSGYYYLKNGERVPSRAYQRCDLEEPLLYQITGIYTYGKYNRTWDETIATMLEKLEELRPWLETGTR